MTRTPQQPPDAPEAIERGPEEDEVAPQPEMAVLRGIAEHRVKQPASVAFAPETVLNHLTEGFRRHPAWPSVRADAAILLYDTLFLLGVGEQTIRDALGTDACARISQLGSRKWEAAERPRSGNGPDL